MGSKAQQRTIRVVIGIGAGVILAVPSLVVAVAAAGGGHGIYGPAAVLFPYTMLSTRFFGEITAPLVALALVQYPLYGVAVALPGRRLGTWIAIGALLVLHILVSVAAVYGRDAGFYP